MSSTIYWLQLGGNSLVNDDKGWCQFPATAMAPPSCAEKFGLDPQPWHGVTTGHRGHGSFANTRIIDFSDPKESVYCRPICLGGAPKCCAEDEDLCPIFLEGAEGWPNQVGINDYYCRTMRKNLKVGDCIATNLVPALERFASFDYMVMRKTPGVTGKFKLMCADVDLTPTIDFGQFNPHRQTVDIFTEFGNDVVNGNLCDGYDVILFEIESMPDDAPAEDCKPAQGKLDNFVLYADPRMEALCTGK